MNNKYRTFQVDSNYFCAGLIEKDGKVIEAAPIQKWMIGKNIEYIKEYCVKKKWKLLLVNK